MTNLADDPAVEADLKVWRERLVRELEGRPEGFTDGHRLTPVGHETPSCLPGFEANERV